MSWDSLKGLARMAKRGQGQLAGSRVSQEMRLPCRWRGDFRDQGWHFPASVSQARGASSHKDSSKHLAVKTMDDYDMDTSNPVQGHSKWSGSTAPRGLEWQAVSAHPGNCPTTHPVAHNRGKDIPSSHIPDTGYHLINHGPHSHPTVLQLLVGGGGARGHLYQAASSQTLHLFS